MLKSCLVAASIAFTVALPAIADQGTITVHVTGLKNSDGVVRVALFNSAESYNKSKSSEDKAGGAFKKDVAPINLQKSTYSFADVPGFSNNALGKMGPPSYDKAKFKLDQTELTIDISAHSGI